MKFFSHSGLGPNEQRLPANVRAFWAIQIVLAGLFLVWSWIYYKRGYRDAVHGWPFFGYPKFSDFSVFERRFQFLHHLDFFSAAPSRGPLFVYPAPAGVPYALFYLFPRYRVFLVITLVLLLGLQILAARALLARGLSRRTTVLLLLSGTLLSYPFWFEWMGGNIEVIIFFLVAAGLLAFMRGRSTSAAVLFGLATSMKWFPLVFFGLFLPRKQFRPIVLGALVTIGSTIASLWLLCPSLPVAWHGMHQSLAIYQQRYFLAMPSSAPWDHSLLCAIRDIYGFFWHRAITQAFLNTYTFCVAFAGIVLFFTVIRKLPLLNQICSLTLAAIWLPPTSLEYTLLHLFLPAVLLILLSLEAQRANVRVPGLTAGLICCAVLLAPENEVVLRYPYGCGGFIKAVVMLAFFYVVLRFPLQIPKQEQEIACMPAENAVPQ